MTEAVRLVIWDLDETFWRGTLTEGGIEYVDAHQTIVETLARRGIVSAICSKNDLDPVRVLLTDRGIWDSFVFPSIDWTAKGPRLAAMIEAIGLRPPTVLFIDDNPMNRNEALHYVPGIQVADETIVPALLDDPRLQGKDDGKLTRLAQYKLLETRRADQDRGGDATEFLRSSNIQVTFEADIERHLDRAIELINRTNQLNFTKKRLPEDIDAARAELREQLGRRNIQAGLISVRDNYGDYGFVGLYVMLSHSRILEHFCFSCRTLGMGVERWVFERLGRPSVNIQGEVLTDLNTAGPVPDWINQAPREGGKAGPRIAGRVVLRGGCDMMAIGHYLRVVSDDVVEEFPYARHGRPMRIDHSQFLRYAIDGMTSAQTEAAEAMGHPASDFTSVLTDRANPPAAALLSFWMDLTCATYHHRESGFRLPVPLPLWDNGRDVRALDEEQLVKILPDAQARDTLLPLRDQYDHEPRDLARLAENAARIFASIDASTRVFVLEAIARRPLADGSTKLFPVNADLNQTVRAAAEPYPNIEFLAIEDMIASPSDVIDIWHFDRLVYHRIYTALIARMTAESEAARQAA